MGYTDKYAMTVEENKAYAKRNVVDYIYSSAKLEGLNITFPETYAIYESAKNISMDVDTVETVINLKHAWNYIFTKLGQNTDVNLLIDLHREVARGQALIWGQLRTGEVGIGGTDYKPPIPNADALSKEIEYLLEGSASSTEKSIDLMLYIMRTQPFWDGNKRAAMLIANKNMIENGCGIITVSPENLLAFNNELSDYYTSGEPSSIKEFIYSKCIDGVKL